MDEASFCIGFPDGSIIRSINLLEVRQPDLEPMPKDPQHYPANLADWPRQERFVRIENWARARV
jgi:hypothetical protein